MLTTMTKKCSPLNDFLIKRLKELNLSIRAFARRVGVSHVFIVQVKQGQAPFPGEQFLKWCDALELNEEMRDEFLHSSLIPQCPQELQNYISKLEATARRCKGSMKAHQEIMS